MPVLGGDLAILQALGQGRWLPYCAAGAIMHQAYPLALAFSYDDINEIGIIKKTIHGAFSLTMGNAVCPERPKKAMLPFQ